LYNNYLFCFEFNIFTKSTSSVSDRYILCSLDNYFTVSEHDFVSITIETAYRVIFSIQKLDRSETKNESRQTVARRLRVEQRRNVREIYRKRKIILIKKVHELEKLCEIDIAVIICRNNRYLIYRSINRQL